LIAEVENSPLKRPRQGESFPEASDVNEVYSVCKVRAANLQ